MHSRLLNLFASLATIALAASTRQTTKGSIVAPAEGTNIAPGQAFDFAYSTMADYGVSSYNYTVWLFTSMPTSFVQSPNFGEGYFFGRFAEPNYPGNPNPKNPAPPTLTMPDFSKNPGGFGSGAVESNGEFTLLVMEEYATGAGSVGSRLALAMNRIVYNATTKE
ncbi:hypothetical protein C8F01DRAFT_523324 [Mycena amicta]|nr:hypothetical protein C8F01DRAFT_523324 [Mycena amicta]